MRTLSGRAFGAALGLVADRLLGEPPLPDPLHPVALFGTAATRLERRLYADRAAPGLAYAAAGLATAGLAGRAVRSPTVAAYLSVSGRSLHHAAASVGEAACAGDLQRARELLPWLVGRDPAQLDAAEIARAVVESVAENTTDAIVAPALWAAACGAPGAFLHRAADTLDSMVGYRDDRYRRFGLAAARLDDVMAWLPARATAALVILVRPRATAPIVAVVRGDAAAHPSPNAGVAEAAFAGALGIRLGGANRYGDVVESRPAIGSGPAPSPGDIGRAIRLSRDVTWALVGLLGVAGLAGGAIGRARSRR
ncbi:MAG: adenosylcobinamide-phosphate synthase CbiB [Acidimicrobiales bacterium]